MNLSRLLKLRLIVLNIINLKGSEPKRFGKTKKFNLQSLIILIFSSSESELSTTLFIYLRKYYLVNIIIKILNLKIENIPKVFY